MPRRTLTMIPLLAAAVVLSACRVERTPDDYFDRRASAADERSAATAEVRDRLLAFVAAAARGDGLQAALALSPAPGVQLVTPTGAELEGEDTVRAAIALLVTTPVALRAQEVEVETAERGAVAWFRMLVEAPGTTAEPAIYRATGTFLNSAGLWMLVQAHVSGPVTLDLLAGESPEESDATPAAAE